MNLTVTEAALVMRINRRLRHDTYGGVPTKMLCKTRDSRSALSNLGRFPLLQVHTNTVIDCGDKLPERLRLELGVLSEQETVIWA